MIGYDPAAQAIREALGLPYATGADDPDVRHPTASHDHLDAQPEARPAS